MGLIKEALYYYGSRSVFSSAVQNQKKNKDFYFYTLNKVDYYIINKSNFLYNNIVPYIQYYITYDLLSRIRSKSFKELDCNELDIYSKLIENLLNNIEDKYSVLKFILLNYF